MQRDERRKKMKVALYLPVALLTLAFVPIAATAQQWTTSTNSSNNISNTNTGNVGVGTSAPAEKLEVSVPSGNMGIRISNGNAATDYSAFRFFQGGAEKGVIFTNQENFFIRRSGTGNLILNDLGGNVGIGNTIPANALHVIASSQGDGIRLEGSTAGPKSPGFHLFDGSTQRGTFGLAESSGSFSDSASSGDIVLRANTGKLLLQTGTASATMALSGGSVGIGTTAPAAKLNIDPQGGGGILIGNPNTGSGGFTSLQLGISANTGGYTWLQSIQSAGSSWGSIILNSYGGNVGIGTTTPSASYKLDVAGSINGTGLCIASDCKTSWSQVGGAGSSQWTTTGANIYFNTGNVGIGTASPGSRLSVEGGGYTVGSVGSPFYEGFRVRANDYAANGGYLLFGKQTGLGGYGVIQAGDNNVYDNLVLNPSGGNVGIGTVSPTYPLDILAAAKASGGNTYGVRLQQTLNENTANNGVATALYINPSFYDGQAAWVTHNALITTNGNVGFGVGTAGAGLDVQNPGVANGTTATYGTRFQQTIASAGNNANSVAVLINPIFNDGVAVGVNHTGLAVTSGRVGFGTATPNYSLDVQGGQINTSGGLCIAGDCKTSWAQVGGGSASNVGAVNVSSGQFGANLGGGNFSFPASVGVGTSSPQVKLAVGGAGVNVYATDAWVENNIHVQGPETLTQGGGRGRLRVGSAWGYSGLYTDGSSVNNGNDLVLGASSHTVRVGPGGAENQNLIVPNGDITASGTITGGKIQATYQDVAEWVPSTQRLAAGTVVVLDVDQSNHVLASTRAYDTRVAGVVSDSPGVILGQGGDDKVKVATTGRVKVKVDATRAPIQIGDLLVTSDKEGIAMKSLPVDLGGTAIHRPGTIIGKALEPLEKGAGEILVLLSLQ